MPSMGHRSTPLPCFTIELAMLRKDSLQKTQKLSSPGSQLLGPGYCHWALGSEAKYANSIHDIKAAILNDVVVLTKIYKNGQRVELTMTLHIRVPLKIKSTFLDLGI